MADNFLLVLPLLLSLLGCIAAAFFPSNARNAEAWLAALVCLGGLASVIALFPAVAAGEIIHFELLWMPDFGLNFQLRLDGFAWMFAVLVTGIGFLVVLYARYYMSPQDPVPRFFSFLLGFKGAMLGIVLSGNLIQIAFFWELTSLFSFLLIGYWHHNARARDGARMALTVTATGGLSMLAGMLLVGHIVGSYELDTVLEAGDVLRAHPLYLPALVLILLGALTKSAQFPFHFWLPQAMAAPTPVSAYLHSATMVKAGVFLLTRMWPVLSGTDAWFWIVGTVGLCTFVLGAYLATFQQDLKGILAYSTISHLGLITLLLGLDTALGVVAAVFHMLNHATFKASLFMGAGVIDHETGTRDVRRLSGLYSFMPISATLAMVAAASMAGVPLLNGFLSKEMFFAETVALKSGNLLEQLLPFIATIAAAFSVVYSLRFIREVFFGPPPTDLPRQPSEAPSWMLLPIGVLVLLCLVVGIFPSATVGPTLNVAVQSILGADTPDYSLAIWHGLTLPLVMSVIAMVGGTLLYVLLHKRLSVATHPPGLNINSQTIFDRVMIFFSWRFARTVEELLGTGKLQPMLRVLVLAGVIAVLWSMRNLEVDWTPTVQAADLGFGLLWIVGAICAIAAAVQAKYHRLAALILMGGAGLTVCLTFVWLSAPDLALTQLMVEVVTTVLLLLGLRWLPKRSETLRSGSRIRPRRVMDLFISLVVAGGVAWLSYAIMTQPAGNTVASYFLENAYAEGGGTNVVNVILVDFRAFDTLGEITVLAIVALTVFALLRRFRPAPDSVGPTKQQQLQMDAELHTVTDPSGATWDDGNLTPALMMRLFFPVIAMVGVYLFLRGHDQPGGGFVAGLTLSIAVIVQYMAGGTRWVESRLAIHPVRWMGFGLLFALVTGIGAMLLGYPLLTSDFRYLDIPLIGEVPMASALLFDLGVFALVVGATVLILIALAHQSIRSHRPTKIEIPVYQPNRGD